MKINKAILCAALGLSVAGIAGADEIYMTGSTAARAAVYATLMNPGSVFSAVPVFTGFGAAGNGDGYMAFSGTLVGGSGTTIINCHWSGSEAGITDTATPTGNPETFMADSLISSTTTSDTSGNPGSTQSHNVDLAMADNAPTYSPSYSKITNPALANQGIVGVVPFKWVRNPGVTPSGGVQFGNVTDSEIRQVLNGGTKLSVFTGNSADSTTWVYVAGRDNSSGTRVNAFGDSGFGASSTPGQIEINADGTLNYSSIRGVKTYTQDWGQSSGGSLAAELEISTASAADANKSTTGYTAIGYLGVSDATTATTHGATLLTYNGVAFSDAAIEEGNYTFWGNEYVLQTAYNYGTQSTHVAAVYSSLTSSTTGVTSQADGNILIPLSAMHCSRTSPGADPTHN
jgi:hypothetical protein